MSPLAEVAVLFLRLGVTAFGGPAAHIALIERECVERRQWISRAHFLDILGVANLVPGPTSTELAMHVGRQRAGWLGLVVAGLAFIVPAAIFVGFIAFVYSRSGELPVVRGVISAVQPVVLVMILAALIPLARTAIRSVAAVAIAIVVGTLALCGLSEIGLLLGAGAVSMIANARASAAAAGVLVSGAVVAAAAPQIATLDVFAYFMRIGSLLFGSGYVLLPVLQGDLVARRGWLTEAQLIDAVAAGQATPGPVFTTATFIGYVLGGPWVAVAATVGMFLPAFVFSAVSSVALSRLRQSRHARRFLDGVNAAAVALIAVVLVTLGAAALGGPVQIAICVVAGLAIFVGHMNPALVLLAAALGGAIFGASSPSGNLQ